MADVVLIVDDVREWRDQLEDWVSELELGYGCVVTSDPEAGREAIYTLRPAALVLDLKFQPKAADVNVFLGWLLAEQAMFCNVPTLIVTGYAVEAASTVSQFEVVAFFDKGTVTKKAFQEGLIRAQQATQKRALRGRKKLEMIQSTRTRAAKAMRASIPNTVSIRWLLLKAFNDEELTTFCFDHFRPVFDVFSTGMSFRQKVQFLIEHCERHKETEKLLRLAKKYNPATFAEFELLPGSDPAW
jgi:hypothetical protein